MIEYSNKAAGLKPGIFIRKLYAVGSRFSDNWKIEFDMKFYFQELTILFYAE